jgi:hypothetical protein
VIARVTEAGLPAVARSWATWPTFAKATVGTRRLVVVSALACQP